MKRIRFQRDSSTEEPDINLIPLIDVLLVIVIFLVCSTSFVRQAALNVDLPGTQQTQTQPIENPWVIRISQDGQFALLADGTPNSAQYSSTAMDAFALKNAVNEALSAQIPNKKPAEQRVIIEADAKASHQSVVAAMDALASLGVSRVGIATATTAAGAKP